MNELLLWSLNRARQQTLNLVADIDEAQMCHQAVPGENHPTWTLGHLYMGDCFFLSLFQIPNGPKMPDGWLELYAPGHAPTGDAQRYHSKAQLVELLMEADRLRQEAFKQLTEDDLARPNPMEQMAVVQPTLGHVLHYALFHEGNHGGQLANWRKNRGLPSGSGAFGVI